MDRAIMNTSESTCSVLGSILKLKISGDVLQCVVLLYGCYAEQLASRRHYTFRFKCYLSRGTNLQSPKKAS